MGGTQAHRAIEISVRRRPKAAALCERHGGPPPVPERGAPAAKNCPEPPPGGVRRGVLVASRARLAIVFSAATALGAASRSVRGVGARDRLGPVDAVPLEWLVAPASSWFAWSTPGARWRHGRRGGRLGEGRGDTGAFIACAALIHAFEPPVVREACWAASDADRQARCWPECSRVRAMPSSPSNRTS